MNRRQRLAASASVGFVALAVGGAAPSYASCAEDSGPEESPVIFVGTADGERRGFTHFAVAEVWSGPDLAPGVWVLSGQPQPRWPLNLFSAVSSSVDADFVDGGRYVVGASRQFRTGSCSVAEVSSGRAAPGRPGAVRPPTPQGDEGVDPPIGPVGQTLTVVGPLALIGCCIGWVARRRGRGDDRTTVDG